MFPFFFLIWYILEEMIQVKGMSRVTTCLVGKGPFTKIQSWKLKKLQLIKNSIYLKIPTKMLQYNDQNKYFLHYSTLYSLIMFVLDYPKHEHTCCHKLVKKMCEICSSRLCFFQFVNLKIYWMLYFFKHINATKHARLGPTDTLYFEFDKTG